MYKIAAIIGGVLLMAGVALAGTVSSLGSPSSPTIGQTIPTATTSTTRQEDRAQKPERGEDLRGRCDEVEHANDPRCTGTATALPPVMTTPPTTTGAATTAGLARPTPARASTRAARTTAATPAMAAAATPATTRASP